VLYKLGDDSECIRYIDEVSSQPIFWDSEFPRGAQLKACIRSPESKPADPSFDRPAPVLDPNPGPLVCRVSNMTWADLGAALLRAKEETTKNSTEQKSARVRIVLPLARSASQGESQSQATSEAPSEDDPDRPNKRKNPESHKKRQSSRLQKGDRGADTASQDDDVIKAMADLIPPVPCPCGDPVDAPYLKNFAESVREAFGANPGRKKNTTFLSPTPLYAFDVKQEIDEVTAIANMKELADTEEELLLFVRDTEENSGIFDVLLQFVLRVTTRQVFWAKSLKDKLFPHFNKAMEALSTFLLQSIALAKASLLHSLSFGEEEPEKSRRPRTFLSELLNLYLCAAELRFDAFLFTNQRPEVASCKKFLKVITSSNFTSFLDSVTVTQFNLRLDWLNASLALHDGNYDTTLTLLLRCKATLEDVGFCSLLNWYFSFRGIIFSLRVFLTCFFFSRYNYVLSQRAVKDRIQKVQNEDKLFKATNEMKSSSSEAVINYLAPILLDSEGPDAAVSQEKELLEHMSFTEKYKLMDLLEEKCVQASDQKRQAQSLALIFSEIIDFRDFHPANVSPHFSLQLLSN